MRYLEMQYGPVIAQRGYAGLDGLGMIELGEISSEQEAQSVLDDGKAYANLKIKSAAEWLVGANVIVQAMQKYGWSAEKRDELDVNLSGAYDEIERMMQRVYELRDQGVIDQPQVDRVFGMRKPVIERIQTLSQQARKAQTKAEFDNWLFVWTGNTEHLNALLEVIAELKNIWRFIKKALEAAPEIVKGAFEFAKLLPWILGGAALLILGPKLLGAVGANPRPRRNRKGGFGGLLPVALAAGAAYVILSKPKPKTPEVTELIPTVRAVPATPRPTAAPVTTVSIGVVPKALTMSFEQELQLADIPYTIADRGEQGKEFFIESQSVLKAKGILEFIGAITQGVMKAAPGVPSGAFSF